MNWKLILLLSPFGVAMAFATVFGLPRSIEMLLWLIIFVIYAILIVKNAEGKYFLHGFLVSVVNGVWIGIIHSAFFSTYIANNPGMMESYQKMPQFLSPQVMMLLVGPIVGAVTGVIAGVFSLIAANVMKKSKQQATPSEQGFLASIVHS